ncbi:MAG: hypothetical protein ACFB02_08075 [Mastigocoleus sp.]
MNKIIYPTLNLFLYDIRDELGQSKEEFTQNQEYFKLKLPSTLSASISSHDRGFNVEYGELLGSQRIERFTSKNKTYEGYYYPVRMNDTYGLLLDCSINDKVNPQPVSCLKNLRMEVERKIQGSRYSIGQTWMILGYLSEDYLVGDDISVSDSISGILDIAYECYENLMPHRNAEKDYQGDGSILGGKLFEFWHHEFNLPGELVDNIPEIGDFVENNHVIVVLFPNQADMRQFSELNYDWMRLFKYRNTILWAYAQSLLLKEMLKNQFQYIQGYIRDLMGDKSQYISNEKLKKILDEARISMSEYAIDFTYFKSQARTIKTNLYNYQKILSSIIESANKANLSKNRASYVPRIIVDNDLCVLEEFWRNSSEKYHLQLTRDSENLRPGIGLLEVLIETIQATVTLRQAESDRKFNATIQTWGWGLAIASIFVSIVSSSIGEVSIDKKNLPFKNYLTDIFPGLYDEWVTSVYIFFLNIISFTISLLLALAVWYLFQKFLSFLGRLWRLKNRKR